MLKKNQILAHRGFWKTATEMNTPDAFARALSEGYGIETDLRDCLGKLVISHDIAEPDAFSLHAFFELYSSYKDAGPLALNIKADGLANLVCKALHAYEINPKNVFVFDMSVPDMRQYLKLGVQVYTRSSEQETPAFYEDVDGIWVDSFEAQGANVLDAARFLGAGKKVAFVSPELHGRSPHPKWSTLRRRLQDMADPICEKFQLCTDYPDQASEYFS